MNFVIKDGKIRVISQKVEYSYTQKTLSGLQENKVTGVKYVLNGESVTDEFHRIEFQLSGEGYSGVSITINEVDSSKIIEFDGVPASSVEEAESIIKNGSLAEQLIQAQFELDSLKLGLTN